MAGRIINKLQHDDEESLYPTLDAANARLKEMLEKFKSQGYTITITKDDQGPVYIVADQQSKPVGHYYVE